MNYFTPTDPLTGPMSEKRILHIRESIALAKAKEADTHSLQLFLQSKLNDLHRTINLPDEKADEVLIDFLTRYIEHVPDFLQALTELTKSAGIYSFAKSFLDIAEDYFEKPPELIGEHHQGLHALIDEAYLAHRLIEEVNDRVMMRCGIPLAPMDMTISNIIVHDLLGDEFANQLDLAVHYSTEVLFEKIDLEQSPEFQTYVSAHQRDGWSEELNKWPCLAGDSSISLNLEHRSSPFSLH